MIRISQLKIPADEVLKAGKGEALTVAAGRDSAVVVRLYELAASRLKIPVSQIKSLEISRRSTDARKKPVSFVYTVDVETASERQILKHAGCQDAVLHEKKPYRFPDHGPDKLPGRPVIIGAGPAGLFCGLMLARSGYRPVLIERGEKVSERKKSVEHFWKTGELKPSSNVQFGEGGAGTFSDGKLNTSVKDPHGRVRLVLETFVSAGAPEEILYDSRPHLGTDILGGIVTDIRKEIEAYGGEVRFNTTLTDIEVRDGAVKGVWLDVGEFLETGVLIPAIGHSSRDTFYMLEKNGVPMEPKPFAVGVRIEHPQSLIDSYVYGENFPEGLPAASYKLARKTACGRGVYSFCMCPGGYVVDASTETGRKAVNGMSFSARDAQNANSAMVVTVTPEDFGGDKALAGVEFQRRLEEAAYRAGKGKIPVQLLGDFINKTPSKNFGDIRPCIKGGYTPGDVRGIFPEQLGDALEEGIRGCGKIIPGFDREDAVLSGVESRTSSPVRILRDGTLQSAIRGLYPCGEGAGYAGGITSAAMDGIKVAEAVASMYAPA